MRIVVISLLLLIFFSSCSKKTDNGLFKEASELESKKDFQRSAELFESVVSQFPTSAYAESSLIHLSVLYNNELKDARLAIHTYQRCYTMFPSSSQASTMLFLSGFVYNNELHRIDSARMIYETFLQKYPTHELAPSAKFEIETLGQDPLVALKPMVTKSDSAANKPQKKVAKK